MATATTESGPAQPVRGVMLTHVVTDPAAYRPGSLGRELTADHRLGRGQPARPRAGHLRRHRTARPTTATRAPSTADDIGLRISADADGEAALDQAMTFARELSATIGR